MGEKRSTFSIGAPEDRRRTHTPLRLPPHPSSSRGEVSGLPGVSCPHAQPRTPPHPRGATVRQLLSLPYLLEGER
jgi:hypothetical protein